MSDELDRYYELLGVRPGASGRELKDAYRDLAKVWHPDRFAHDPRLQQKAQEKLKEINEAYELLTSGKAGGRARTRPAPDRPHAPAAQVRRKRPSLFLLVALVFCAVFLAALKSLPPTGARTEADGTPTAERKEAATSDKGQQPEGETRSVGQAARDKARAGRQPASEPTAGQGSGAAAPPLRPMPTVTVTIDAVTGQLATRDCPVVSTVTFPAGGEPSLRCAAEHRPKEAAKGSRLKTVGKGLAAPLKWLGGGKGARTGESRDARPAGGDGARNR